MKGSATVGPTWSGGNIASIQMLRFFAAFFVVLFHSRSALMKELPLHNHDNVDRAFALGAAGVHLFFLISGFVMVYTAMRPGRKLSPVNFLRRRFIRIYPIYWLIALVYLVVHAALGEPYLLDTWTIAGAFLLIPVHAPAIIGPGWTLAYEVYFYACFGLALLLPGRWGLLLLSSAFVGMIALARIMPGLEQVFGIATNALLLEFLAGCAVGLAYLDNWRIPKILGVLLLLTGVGGLVVGLPLEFENYPTVLVWGAPSLALLLGGLALEPVLQGSLFRFLARLGDSSYFLYLVHILLLYLLLQTPLSRLGEVWLTNAIFPLLLAVSCAVFAHLGHHFIELPLIKAFRRIPGLGT